MTEATMPVTVEQCDRDLATQFMERFRPPGWENAVANIPKGHADLSWSVQQIAHHRLNTRATPPSPAGLAGEPIDSGMDAASVERAEWLWANLPTGPRKWTSLATHEKALVCHTVARLTANGSQPDRVVDALRADDEPQIVDDFRGDNVLLKQSIAGLLSFDRDGKIVPHGIGGHAHSLLSAAYRRLP